jgi:hypothetical protein
MMLCLVTLGSCAAHRRWPRACESLIPLKTIFPDGAKVRRVRLIIDDSLCVNLRLP